MSGLSCTFPSVTFFYSSVCMVRRLFLLLLDYDFLLNLTDFFDLDEALDALECFPVPWEPSSSKSLVLLDESSSSSAIASFFFLASLAFCLRRFKRPVRRY